MTVTAAQCLTWREILSVARHAPSPHNVQPWRVRLISETESDLLIDGGRTLPNEDYTGCFLLSAMGMFLEAIDLLAAPRGLKLEFDLCETAEWFAERVSRPGPRELIPFARMRLVEDSPRESPYPATLFLERRTCRIPLRPIPVEGAAVAELVQLASAWGHRYTQVTDGGLIEEILAQNIDAVFHDMNVAAYHDEIARWFRFTDKEAKRHLDGLDRRCMNLSALDFWMSARLPWLLLFPPTRVLLKRIYRRQLATVPTIGILSGEFLRRRTPFTQDGS